MNKEKNNNPNEDFDQPSFLYQCKLKEKGVNFNASFEEILSQLKNVPSPTNNMIGLMKFMENRFTREQRDLILKSIR